MEKNLSDICINKLSEMSGTLRENEGGDAKRRDKVLQKANNKG